MGGLTGFVLGHEEIEIRVQPTGIQEGLYKNKFGSRQTAGAFFECLFAVPFSTNHSVLRGPTDRPILL